MALDVKSALNAGETIHKEWQTFANNFTKNASNAKSASPSLQSVLNSTTQMQNTAQQSSPNNNLEDTIANGADSAASELDIAIRSAAQTTENAVNQSEPIISEESIDLD